MRAAYLLSSRDLTEAPYRATHFGGRQSAGREMREKANTSKNEAETLRLVP